MKLTKEQRKLLDKALDIIATADSTLCEVDRLVRKIARSSPDGCEAHDLKEESTDVYYRCAELAAHIEMMLQESE